MGPNLPKFGVFGQFPVFKSLDFSDFSYYDRQAWYLADTRGPMAEKSFPAFRPKFGPKSGFWQISRLRLIRDDIYVYKNPPAEQNV